MGASLWLWGERFPNIVYQGLILAATVLVALSAYYGGEEGWLNGFYLFWIALFVAYFFTPRWITVQLLLIAAGYGFVVLFSDWHRVELIYAGSRRRLT